MWTTQLVRVLAETGCRGTRLTSIHPSPCTRLPPGIQPSSSPLLKNNKKTPGPNHVGRYRSIVRGIPAGILPHVGSRLRTGPRRRRPSTPILTTSIYTPKPSGFSRPWTAPCCPQTRPTSFQPTSPWRRTQASCPPGGQAEVLVCSHRPRTGSSPRGPTFSWRPTCGCSLGITRSLPVLLASP